MILFGQTSLFETTSPTEIMENEGEKSDIEKRQVCSCSPHLLRCSANAFAVRSAKRNAQRNPGR